MRLVPPTPGGALVRGRDGEAGQRERLGPRCAPPTAPLNMLSTAGVAGATAAGAGWVGGRVGGGWGCHSIPVPRRRSRQGHAQPEAPRGAGARLVPGPPVPPAARAAWPRILPQRPITPTPRPARPPAARPVVPHAGARLRCGRRRGRADQGGLPHAVARLCAAGGPGPGRRLRRGWLARWPQAERCKFAGAGYLMPIILFRFHTNEKSGTLPDVSYQASSLCAAPFPMQN